MQRKHLNYFRVRVFKMHMFKTTKYIASHLCSGHFSIKANPWSEHPGSGICGSFFSMWEVAARKNSCPLPGHLTSVSCYMECGRPYIALIVTEWVAEIKQDQQGCLSFLKEEIFFFFVNFCTGAEEDWMPWGNKADFPASLRPLLPFLIGDLSIQTEPRWEGHLPQLL